MTWEAFVIPVLSALTGWLLRHWGIGPPALLPPQSQPMSGGAVPPPSANSTLRGVIKDIVAAEVQKGVAYLEGRLLSNPAAPPAQSSISK